MRHFLLLICVVWWCDYMPHQLLLFGSMHLIFIFCSLLHNVRYMV